MVVSNICLFSPLFGEDSHFDYFFFQMGWNHQHPPTRSYWNSQSGEVWPWNRRPVLVWLLRKGPKFVLAEIYVNNMFVLDESIFNSWWMWCILIPDHPSPACAGNLRITNLWDICWSKTRRFRRFATKIKGKWLQKSGRLEKSPPWKISSKFAPENLIKIHGTNGIYLPRHEQGEIAW